MRSCRKRVNTRNMKNKAVFLDRDGVLVEDPGYIYTWSKELLIPGSVEAIKLLNQKDFKTIIITNQAGVAKGYYSEKDAILFNQLMIKELELQNAKICAIYCCYHHTEAKLVEYNIDCDCRKPKPGMLKKAEKELDIDLKQSFMIGDKKSDIDAGKMAGCRTMLVLTGNGKDEIREYDIECDYVVKDLYNAVEILIKVSENFGKKQNRYNIN